MNLVLAVAWSCEHDEHFRIGRLNAKLRTDHDFLEQFFCFDFFKMAIFKTMQMTTSSAPPCTLMGAPCCWQEPDWLKICQELSYWLKVHHYAGLELRNARPLLLSYGDFDNK